MTFLHASAVLPDDPNAPLPYPAAYLREILAQVKTIAMVGASADANRPSHFVMKYMQDKGYRVIPVNPNITGEHLYGEFVWRELSQIGVPIDIVDIFRRSEAAGQAVDQAIAVGAKAVWMQLGVIDEAAAERAEAAGLKVVMDRCIKIEILALGIPPIAQEA
jgi:predicted CoA-binding protein